MWTVAQSNGEVLVRVVDGFVTAEATAAGSAPMRIDKGFQVVFRDGSLTAPTAIDYGQLPADEVAAYGRLGITVSAPTTPSTPLPGGGLVKRYSVTSDKSVAGDQPGERRLTVACPDETVLGGGYESAGLVIVGSYPSGKSGETGGAVASAWTITFRNGEGAVTAWVTCTARPGVKTDVVPASLPVGSTKVHAQCGVATTITGGGFRIVTARPSPPLYASFPDPYHDPSVNVNVWTVYGTASTGAGENDLPSQVSAFAVCARGLSTKPVTGPTLKLPPDPRPDTQRCSPGPLVTCKDDRTTSQQTVSCGAGQQVTSAAPITLSPGDAANTAYRMPEVNAPDGQDWRLQVPYHHPTTSPDDPDRKIALPIRTVLICAS